MKTTFRVPNQIVERKTESSECRGTITELRDAIIDLIGRKSITHNSPVYTFDIDTKTAVPYSDTVGGLLNDLENWIAKRRGNAVWVFDREDGWHDPVICLHAYRRGTCWVLLIGVEPGYQDEEED